MVYYLAIKKDKFGTFIDTCVDLETILMSELNRETM